MKNFYLLFSMLACLAVPSFLSGQALTNSGATNCLGVANLFLSGADNNTSVQWNKNSVSIVSTTAVYASSGATVAGNSGGTGGSLASQLRFPGGVFVDASGNIFVADQYNHRVQKFPPTSASGTSGTTVAGLASSTSGVASNALNLPAGIFVDASGNIYVADQMNNRIQKFPSNSIAGTNGVTVAGQTDGTGGTDASHLSQPHSVFLDAAGYIYVADYGNHRIQKFPPTSTAGANGSTVAGQSVVASGADNMHLNNPTGVYADAAGNLYISDAGNNRIQKWSGGSSGQTVAGGAAATLTANKLGAPSSVYVDPAGYIYVADYNNNRVQKFPPNSVAGTNGATVVGQQSGVNNPIDGAHLRNPASVFVDLSGSVFVTDYYYNRIQKLAISGITYTPTSAGTYTAVFTSGGVQTTSNAITVNAASTPTASIAVTSGAQTICYGTSVTFTATAANWVAPAYQWKKNGNNAGSNSATYTDATLANGDAITCVVTGTAVCGSASSITSNNIAMTVNPAVAPSVTISLTGGSQTICAGTTANFSATAFNGGTSPSYQWKKNGNNVGANSATYSDATLASNDAITCVLTSSALCAAPAAATSNSMTISVTPTVAPSVAVAITAGSQTICSGTSVTFTATATNGGASPTYQWKKNNVNAGSNSPTYTDATLANNDVVACVLTSSAVCPSPSTATSAGVTMTVNPSVIPTISIAVTSGSQTISPGTSVTFTATAANGGASPAYQWKKNNVSVGSNSPTYTDGSLANGDVVNCTLTSSAVCAAPATAVSNSVTISVSVVANPSYCLKINKLSETSTTLTVEALLTSLDNASWSADATLSITGGGSVTGTHIVGNAGNIGSGYSTPVKLRENSGNDGSQNPIFKYDFIFNKNNAAAPASFTIDDASGNFGVKDGSVRLARDLTGCPVNCILSPAVAITSTADAANDLVCAGTIVTFNVSSTTHAGGAPRYQWLVNNNPVGSNTTAASYSYAPANGDVVSVVMTSDAASFGPGCLVEQAYNLGAAGLQAKAAGVAIKADAIPPILAGVPANVTSDCASVPTAAVATATDNFDPQPKVTVAETRANGSCAYNYTLTRTWTATDVCGNSSTASQVVTVQDKTSPALAGIPTAATVECSAVPTIASVTSVSATDNCDAAPIVSAADVKTAGSCANSYTLTRTWTATDVCGNSSTVSQIITVQDKTAPTLAGAPAAATVECGGVPAASINAVSAADNCDAHPVVTVADATAAGSCPGNYTLTRTWTATDACGNSSTVAQIITVQDKTAPALTGIPASATAECSSVPAASISSVTATDACDAHPMLSVADVKTAGTCAGNYTLTRTWTATDACGNSATASQIITVQDKTAPTLAGAPAAATVECSAVPAAAVNSITATDACDAAPGVTVADVKTAGSCANNYILTRTWTATDACGNAATVSQVITVQDKTAPVLSGAPAGILVGCSEIPVAAAVTASDACDALVNVGFKEIKTLGSGGDYTLTRTWTATDACGNSATASQIITVQNISILTQPAALSECAGAAGALSVSATGGANITYQWQSRTGAAAFSAIAGAASFTYIPNSQSLGNVDYQVIVSAPGNVCTAATSNTATVTTVDCVPKLRAKVYLEGAYNPATGLISDGLRAAHKIPSAQPYNAITFITTAFAGNSPTTPYTGTETVADAVLAVSTGDTAIVDWVLVEIRDITAGAANVITRRAALLRQDGKIVDVDGYSPVGFKDLASSGGAFNYLLNGAYHIAVRHRLALGTRTQTAIPMGAANIAAPSLTDLDFTTTANALAGSRKLMSNGKYTLYMGDTDRDGVIGAADIANLRARNPTPPMFFLYAVGYDLDFDASIFSSDISIARGNNPVLQVDLKQ